ncbi:translation initiation factor IF-2-like [Ailuropoda melanoleuca]|uniref:translation initiation factor IF-2-like n=1 Tax=Ailuropoda melanoleuca TaxID=9646 RepID=UPI001494C8FA|nr:translation initiation factor IF-2-like [Ailuropoda melanoleuca]
MKVFEVASEARAGPAAAAVVVRSLAARFPRPGDLASAGAATTAATSGGGPGSSRRVGGGPRGLQPATPSPEETAAGGGGGSGLPPSGAAPARAATLTARRPLPAVRFLSVPQASAGTRGGAAGLGTRRPLGSWGPERPGFTSRPPRAARPSGGASARPESDGRLPLLFLSPRNLPIILPPRLEPCARRARNKHHI